MITTKQVQKASSSNRRNGLYLVQRAGTIIGMIEKPYHSDIYRAQINGATFVTCSTKQQAIMAFEMKNMSSKQ